MQCIHKHIIYTIDKKALKADRDFFVKTKYINVKNIERLGNGSWYYGIEQFTTGKWWVYYDRSPRHSKHRLHRKLFELGYFKFNEVGCGKCEICKVEHSKEWMVKGYCESKMWKNKTFLTFTYNNNSLPFDRKLKRSDIQKFWKDLRYHLYKKTKKARKVDLSEEQENLEEIYSNPLEDVFGPNSRRKNRKPIRYLNCGEYGPKTKRPHYHAVIWNFKPTDLRRHSRDRRGYWLYTSAKINKIWGKGYVIIGNAETETVAYVARYCTKKFYRTKDEEETMKKKKQQEFIGASSLGFIGYFYWLKFKEKIKENMGILVKQKEHITLQKIPKAMRKLWEREDEDGYEWYDYQKNKIGKENWEKILSQTGLSESEYIKQTYRLKKKQYKQLKRNGGDLQG